MSAIQRKVRLQLPIEGLEIYLVGPDIWDRDSERLLTPDGKGCYCLDLAVETWAEFKFFAHVQVGQDPAKIRKSMQDAGLVLTGKGDLDPKTFMPRFWFVLPQAKIVGNNMVWTEAAELIFP